MTPQRGSTTSNKTKGTGQKPAYTTKGEDDHGT